MFSRHVEYSSVKMRVIKSGSIALKQFLQTQNHDESHQLLRSAMPPYVVVVHGPSYPAHIVGAGTPQRESFPLVPAMVP